MADRGRRTSGDVLPPIGRRRSTARRTPTSTRFCRARWDSAEYPEPPTIASVTHQHRDVSMGQHLVGDAAEHDSGDATPAVRGHDDEVATLVARRVDDRLVGVVVLHLQ